MAQKVSLLRKAGTTALKKGHLSLLEVLKSYFWVDKVLRLADVSFLFVP